MKNANPSSENGRPMIPPANAMKRGKSKPSSKLMIVPDTAPTAKRIANAFDQRSASARQTGSPVRRCIPSAITIISGNPTPSTANTRWNASEVPIWARPAVRWPMNVAVGFIRECIVLHNIVGTRPPRRGDAFSLLRSPYDAT
jgi:hypothetical protein